MFYDNVIRLCKERRIPVSMVAKSCGIAGGTIGIGARRKSSPQIATARKIANFLGCDINELLKEG